VDRHCELMSASVYAELCGLDAQPTILPAVRSSRAGAPAYIDSSVSGSVVQSSNSSSYGSSGDESNKDWRWWALALSVKVYVMLFKAACHAVRAMRRSNCQSMLLSHGAVGPSACPLIQLISLDPLDRIICDEIGWVPTQELTEGFLSSKSVDDLLDYSLGDYHWSCCALRTYHSSNVMDSWTDYHRRCLFNHLRIESLEHQAICAEKKIHCHDARGLWLSVRQAGRAPGGALARGGGRSIVIDIGIDVCDSPQNTSPRSSGRLQPISAGVTGRRPATDRGRRVHWARRDAQSPNEQNT
jgi:hypothetical protein